MATNQASLVASSSAPGVLYLYGNQARLVEEIDFSTDMTSKTITSAAAHAVVTNHTIFKADGTTPKAGINVAMWDGGGGLPNDWEIQCTASANPPIYLTGTLARTVQKTCYVYGCIDPNWTNPPDWDNDLWILQIVYGGCATPYSVDVNNTQYIAMGAFPSGSSRPWDSLDSLYTYYFANSATGNPHYLVSALCTSAAGEGVIQAVSSAEKFALSGSQLILRDSMGRLAQKQGATDFTDNMMPSGDWDFDVWGSNAIAVTTDVPATSYTNGPGIIYLAMNEMTSGERTAIGVVKVRLYVASPKE